LNDIRELNVSELADVEGGSTWMGTLNLVSAVAALLAPGAGSYDAPKNPPEHAKE
jgi:hypothetical protein